MVYMRSEGRSTPSFRSVPSVAFETFPVFARMAVSLPLARKKDRRAILLSTLLFQAIDGNDVLGFVPGSSVSSSSTFKIFRDVNIF